MRKILFILLTFLSLSGYSQFLIIGPGGPSTQNAPPTVTCPGISGYTFIDSTLTISPTVTYSDDEGDAMDSIHVSWYRSGGTLIQYGDTTYTITAADSSYYIYAWLTPYAATGASPGDSVACDAVGPVVRYSVGASVDTTNYYVSNSGNDAFRGHSQDSAIATIAELATRTLEADDSVFFNKGDTWRETLTVPNSGTAGHYIVFTSYGAGDRPRILGSAADSTWENYQGDTIWRCGTYEDPYGIASAEDAEIWFINMSDSVIWANAKAENVADMDSLYDWYWAGDSIYVRWDSDPGTAFSSLQIPQRRRAVYINDKEYITINGLELGFTVDRTVQTEYPQQATTGLSIEDCYIHHTGSRYAETGYHLAVCRNDILIKDNDVSEAGRRNCSMHIYAVSGLTIQNITYDGNYLHNGYHSTGTSCNLSDGTNVFKHIVIKNNLIYDPPDGYVGAGRAEMMPIRAYYGDSYIEDVEVYNNILVNSQNHGMYLMEVDTIKIYNNTFYDYNHNIASPANIFQLSIRDSCTQVEIKNNIFYGAGDYDYSSVTPLVWVHDASQDVLEIDMDYNLFYQADSRINLLNLEGTETYNASNWTDLYTDLGWQEHPLNHNAHVFTDSFNVRYNSCAVDSGLDRTALVTTDYYGTPRADTSWIGAVIGWAYGDTCLSFTATGGYTDTIPVNAQYFPDQIDSIRLVVDEGNDSIGVYGGTLLYGGTDTTQVQNVNYKYSPSTDTACRAELYIERFGVWCYFPNIDTAFVYAVVKASFSDDFDAYNNSETLHSQADWSQGVGTMTCNGTGIYPNSEGRVAAYYNTATNTNDQFSQLSVNGSSTRYIGVVARYTAADGGNYYFYEGDGDEHRFGKVVAGTPTVIATSTSASGSCVLRMETEGTTIRCYVNGALDTGLTGGTGIFTDSDLSTGYVGVGGYDASAARTGDNWSGGDN